MFHFYTPWKRQKPNIFWRSQGGGVKVLSTEITWSVLPTEITFYIVCTFSRLPVCDL